TPPSPSARSRLRHPVGTVSTATCALESPRRITVPFPQSFSNLAIAASSAFFFSSLLFAIVQFSYLFPDQLFASVIIVLYSLSIVNNILAFLLYTFTCTIKRTFPCFSLQSCIFLLGL